MRSRLPGPDVVEVALARLLLTEDEESVRVAVGTRLFVQARAHLNGGELVDVQWDPQSGHAAVPC